MTTRKKGLLRKYDLIGIPERTVKEILTEESELCDKVWYNRHLYLRSQVEKGKETVNPEIWKGALTSAKKMEENYGRDQLGPYSDFDWGMMNGKLSALRWILGEDWDLPDP